MSLARNDLLTVLVAGLVLLARNDLLTVVVADLVSLARNDLLTAVVAGLVLLARNDLLTMVVAGLVPRVVKVAPACAIMISTYEYFKTHFYNRNLRNSSL